MRPALSRVRHNTASDEPTPHDFRGITKELAQLQKNPRLSGRRWQRMSLVTKRSLQSNLLRAKISALKQMEAPQIITRQSKIISTVIDHEATGCAAKKYRERHAVMQQDVATEMGIKDTNLSAMESGKRNWNAESFGNYINAVNKLKK